MIEGELFEEETLISLISPIQGRKMEEEFRKWLKQFNPFYILFLNREEVLICF